MATPKNNSIESLIYFIRGQKVLLDSDLARIYGVTTKRLIEQLKRNLKRFPADFMFQLTEIEQENLRSQIATSSLEHGGRRYLPYVFTEHGAIMLATILNTPIAIEASVQVVRAFVTIRNILASHKELCKKLDKLEKKYDMQFRVVFDAIRKLMTPLETKQKKIGIITED